MPISNLYERGRSLGLGVQVSAQSWQGLGRDEDERYRIAATADGGIWLMHTPYPEPLVQLAGTRRVLESAHKLIGAPGARKAPPATQHAWTADPDLIRTLDVGQACYIHRGGATFVQVARPKPSPLSLPAARPGPHRDHPAARAAAGRRSHRRRAGPGSLDDVLGPGAARMNPFTVLGLPTDPDLTDEQVRAAWRAIAAATHPDRPDGGDVARYTAAASRLRPAPHRVGPVRGLRRPGRRATQSPLPAAAPRLAALAPVRPGHLRRPGLPARIRHGRPWHLLVRALVAAVLSLLVVHCCRGSRPVPPW